MFKFAFKNMLIKKVKIILIIISIVISATVALLAYNISEQVDKGFKNTNLLLRWIKRPISKVINDNKIPNIGYCVNSIMLLFLSHK